MPIDGQALPKVMIYFSLFLFSFYASAMAPEACSSKGGVIVNTLSHPQCHLGKNVGNIEGTSCPCICCIGEKKIDCDQNKIQIISICDAGNQLKLKLKFMGPEQVDQISLNFKSSKWWAGGTIKISSMSQSEYILDLNDVNQNKGYTELVSFEADYSKAPFAHCQFLKNKQTLNIVPCLTEAKP